MDPGNAGQARNIGAPVGVIHPPFFDDGVPDDRWIGSAIEDWIAVQRFGRDEAGGFTTGYCQGKGSEHQKAADGFHPLSFTNSRHRNQVTEYADASFMVYSGRQKWFHLAWHRA